MVDDPRVEGDYSPRQVEAARRAIVDVMQVLAAFKDCLVLVGGWVPELLLPDADEEHVGSVDVDLALDVEKLGEGRYAEMLKLLIGTGRYRHGEKDFQFVTDVDLDDGDDPVVVEIEFLAPKEIKTKKNKPKLIEGFRVLKADGCGAAFHSPLMTKMEGKMARGARNSVDLQVASVPDFLVMKAFALNGRDKPKDAYDICFCLDHYLGGIPELARVWKGRLEEGGDVAKAIEILREKFDGVDSYGPQQVVEFHNSSEPEERDQQARRAFELVRQFVSQVTGGSESP